MNAEEVSAIIKAWRVIMKRYIIALDEGTTSARTLIYDVKKKEVVSVRNNAFRQIFPKPGWVEHDAEEIYKAQYLSLLEAVSAVPNFKFSDVYALGITNQRETVVAWDKRTLTPIYNAIVWQCRRTTEMTERLAPLKDKIQQKTGLVLDAYFSATKIQWILKNVPVARKLAREGNLRVGTIDTFLIAKLTEGKTFVTDYSNASRTMLFNINTLQWDDELLFELGIPREILPDVVPSSAIVGEADILGQKVPIGGIAGDQQSALFGQGCFEEGCAKNTYGTGCFILMNTGEKPIFSKNGLLTTIAWGVDGKITYALEGSIFNAGSSLQWLRDELNLIKTSHEVDIFAEEVEDTAGVYVVPAFTGLGAPYWNMKARGAIVGLTRGANKKHIARATLESIAYSTKDIVGLMEDDSGIKLKHLKVDGGASKSNFLMQFQADMLGKSIIRPSAQELTAMGAIYLAGLSSGAFGNLDEVEKNFAVGRVFERTMDENAVNDKYRGWKKAVGRSLDWEE